ncbi:MAG TPA: tetratricopeptide repeat protein [Candidatus Binatia bacterium]|nr:tetratricopeptide repeat protein [Candidatus Binatia bacterium]
MPRFVFHVVVLSLTAALSWQPAAAQTLAGTQSLMVMPFENRSNAPGLEWIGEAFPEVLGQRMASSRLYVIGRDDRTYAFDRSGVPATVLPSRATIYRVAEQMDADYVVLGNYNFDGRTFSASAQLLDMKKLHLYAPVESSGPLNNLIDLQTLLAWELLQQLPSHPATTREQFLKASAPIRLNAFENYIRGTLATGQQQKIHYFREALRLDPNYSLAMLQLGKIYFDAHEYESASSWLVRVPKSDPAAGEANFLLGMSEFYRGNYDRALAAFTYLSTLVPLTEVCNNIGVVEARRAHRADAIQYFSRAVNADPKDADYRFNLAVALFKNGDSAAAARQLKEELQQRPADGEARALLDTINRGVPPAAVGASVSGGNQPRIPLERIKHNYDEASYRQLETEIDNLAEARLARTDSHTHAAYHVQRGRELLAENLPEQAETEFRNAIAADYGNEVAHAQLALLLEKKGDVSNARAEAQNSVRLKPNVDGLLVLARLDLRQNQLSSAAGEVERALALEPDNPPALALKRDIAARQTGAK